MKYDSLVRPILFRLSPETAHEMGIDALRIILSSKPARQLAARSFGSEPVQTVPRFGLQFKNPIGIAAGFDKNAVVVNQLAALGFGFVEVGTVTFRPQHGNEKPRLFRLPQDMALINRLGFNNDGAAAIANRLRTLDRDCIVGVNIGKNKDVPNEEAIENYLACFDLVRDVADYITVNISSPNTPNLRELQRGENLEELLKALTVRNREARRARDGGESPAKPILVKIAPDLSESEIGEIVNVCLRYDLDGIIATNTTVSRENLRTSDADRFGAGGLSGRPLAKRSNDVIRSIYRVSGGKLPIIGVGGIFCADDAFEKITAGASLLQVYTGFVYKGPSLAREINSGLARLFKMRGFGTIEDAVGTDA